MLTFIYVNDNDSNFHTIYLCLVCITGSIDNISNIK
uniref:Uncharacterized protein n=1 Tax=Anguilla anguilla TaxID=7936 RepID=A0A0E9PUH7_ANGAN